MTETLLMVLPLFLLIAAMLQIFLIDEYTFRLATKAHEKLFTAVAFPDNRESVPYETRWTSKWDFPERSVPVVPYMEAFGLTADDLVIRSTVRRDRVKRIKLGRGTRWSIEAGAEGLVDVAAILLGTVDDAMSQITRAIEIGDEKQR